MTLFLTSDTHFGHKNILHLGKGRPFNDILDHNETIIKNWNEVVKPTDMVYHLGDFAMGNNLKLLRDWLSRLNGQKHLILGNHDNRKMHSILLQEGLWCSIRDYHMIPITLENKTEIKLVLSHFPILEFNGAWHSNVVHCYGHIHDIVSYDDIYKKLGFKAIHIGVDTSDRIINTKSYTPINVNDIWKQVNLMYVKEK